MVAARAHETRLPGASGRARLERNPTEIMTPRRRAAFALRGALTFACAVLVHGAVHAVGDRSFMWDSPAHGVMLVVALALLAGVAGSLGWTGPRRERRRRLALLRASLGPLGARGLAAGALAQAAFAAVLLGAEGAELAPDRLALALACGLVALLCSTLLLAAGGAQVVRLLVALVARRTPPRGARGPAPPPRAALARERPLPPLRPEPAASDRCLTPTPFFRQPAKEGHVLPFLFRRAARALALLLAARSRARHPRSPKRRPP